MLTGLALVFAASVLPPDFERRIPPDMKFQATDTPALVLKKTLFHYDMCMFGTAKEFSALNNETAEAIANAALGKCTSWERDYMEALFNLELSFTVAGARNAVEKYKTARRPMLASYVMDLRTKGRSP